MEQCCEVHQRCQHKPATAMRSYVAWLGRLTELRGTDDIDQHEDGMHPVGDDSGSDADHVLFWLARLTAALASATTREDALKPAQPSSGHPSACRPAQAASSLALLSSLLHWGQNLTYISARPYLYRNAKQVPIARIWLVGPCSNKGAVLM